nr:reverse transcriptase domain-containing protein [Tanacetum cinerariifolium]
MRTRSSSNFHVVSSSNPSTSTSKHRNRRRSQQPFILEESPVDTMADQRTMAELLRAPIEGYAEAIVVLPILVEQFELKYRAARRWLKKEPPRSIHTWEDLVSKFIIEFFPPSRTANLRNKISNFQQRFDESFHEAWDRYKDLLRSCPHHGFTELHQMDTFYSALNPADQDSLNAAAGGNLLERRTQDVLTIIENKSKQMSVVTTAMTAILKQFQATPPTASVKVVEETCVTYGGAHPYYQCLAAGGNTFPELRDNIQGYISAAVINYNQGNLSYRPLGIANQIRPPDVGERVEETFTDPDHAEYTIKVPPPPVQKYKPPSQREYVVHQRDPLYPNIPYPSKMLKQKQQEKDEVQIHKFWQMFKQLHINVTLADALILMPKYQKILKALLSNKEKLQELENTPLNENCSAVILKKLPEKLRDPRKFLILCGFSELKCKALADLGASFNLMPLSVWKKLGLPELISTRMTLKLANRAIFTPAGIARNVFISVGKFTFPADFVIVDYESDPRVPLILGRPFLRIARALINVHGKEMILRDGDERLILNIRHDTSSYSNQPHRESINLINVFNNSRKDFLEDFTTFSSNPLLEEFADELAFPLKYDDDPQFDIESDLKEIDFLLYQYVDSSLKDSIDQSNLANPADNVVDSSDAKNVYDDPFDSKGEKIKESKLLINELDLPCDFLLSEYDSFISQDFSRVDALPSTNNVEKIFNTGILIQEKSFEIITRVIQNKKLATSNASLMLEDFDPPFYEPLFFKEVPSSNMLLPFSPENEEKVFKPGIHTSKKVHSSFIPELSHPGYKIFKINQIFKSPIKNFLFFYGKDTHTLAVPCLHYYPLDQFEYGGNWVKLSDLKQALRGRHPMLIRSFSNE